MRAAADRRGHNANSGEHLLPISLFGHSLCLVSQPVHKWALYMPHCNHLFEAVHACHGWAYVSGIAGNNSRSRHSPDTGCRCSTPVLVSSAMAGSCSTRLPRTAVRLRFMTARYAADSSTTPGCAHAHACCAHWAHFGNVPHAPRNQRVCETNSICSTAQAASYFFSFRLTAIPRADATLRWPQRVARRLLVGWPSLRRQRIIRQVFFV